MQNTLSVGLTLIGVATSLFLIHFLLAMTMGVQHHQTVLTALALSQDTQHFLCFPNNITRLSLSPWPYPRTPIIFSASQTTSPYCPCSPGSIPGHPSFPLLPKQHHQTVLTALLCPETPNISSTSQTSSSSSNQRIYVKT